MTGHTDNADLECGDGESKVVKGYPSFSNFIVSDRSLAVYHRFDRLSARNLLFLQSQLASLQARQDQFDREDCAAERNEQECRKNWDLFQQRATDPADPHHARESERMKLVVDIRSLLRDYSALLYEIDGQQQLTRGQQEKL